MCLWVASCCCRTVSEKAVWLYGCMVRLNCVLCWSLHSAPVTQPRLPPALPPSLPSPQISYLYLYIWRPGDLQQTFMITKLPLVFPQLSVVRALQTISLRSNHLALQPDNRQPSWWGCRTVSHQPTSPTLAWSSSLYGIERSALYSEYPQNTKRNILNLFFPELQLYLIISPVTIHLSFSASASGSYFQLFKFKEYKDCTRADGNYILPLNPSPINNKKHIRSRYKYRWILT